MRVHGALEAVNGAQAVVLSAPGASGKVRPEARAQVLMGFSQGTSRLARGGEIYQVRVQLPDGTIGLALAADLAPGPLLSTREHAAAGPLPDASPRLAAPGPPRLS